MVVIDKLRKYCPAGKIINPYSERCINLTGKVAKQMLAVYDGNGTIPECTIAKVRNPDTGRCVKINGKVGKKILSTYGAIDVHVIFKPEIWVIGNSSFIRSSRPSKSHQKWDKPDAEHFLQWYKLFAKTIKNILAKHKLQFVRLSTYSEDKIDMQIRCKMMGPLISLLKDVDGVLKDVLQPDTEEDHLIEIDGTLYLVQADEIISVTLEPQK
jgi:hypothetical protein